MRFHFNKITIIGVGLLGASIGLAVKKSGAGRQICGFFRDKNKARDARRLRIVDTCAFDLAEAIRESELIILASPVKDIIQKLAQLKKLKTAGTLITDVGSTKEEIVAAADGLNFVGSHPLAGSEQSGMNHAREDLFRNSLCIVTPKGSQAASVKMVRGFWEGLGARTIILKAKDHDRALAYTSHLPHSVAYALANTIPLKLTHLAAGGLKDATRIALSTPELWQDIFLTNRRELLRCIAAFEYNLKTLKKAVAANNEKTLLRFLTQARNKRRKIL